MLLLMFRLWVEARVLPDVYVYSWNLELELRFALGLKFMVIPQDLWSPSCLCVASIAVLGRPI